MRCFSHEFALKDLTFPKKESTEVFRPPREISIYVIEHILRDRTAMANHSTCPPLERSSVQAAHKRIKSYVHLTPVATCETINQIASTPQSERCSNTGANMASERAPHERGISGDATIYSASPQVKIFFKCENQQRVGAFKARGAFHALGRLIEEDGLENVRKAGVCTHSSGESIAPTVYICTDS